ncbi:hypothetical protein JR316_0010366 [Psilocybe cubensis]|uniref:Uncharacterized protein n=2 Tax=Psilocybe cubensis TaxID=181762 RepID=A0ACB8GLI8_PSICU|nr:hypothetical protein JR316_0010366 [Psilocybe cubensis]KAH9476454.1 hypothetical protein JR316_0010366 [Psilocybe cubensis]
MSMQNLYQTSLPTYAAVVHSPQSDSDASSVNVDISYREMDAFINYDYNSDSENPNPSVGPDRTTESEQKERQTNSPPSANPHSNSQRLDTCNSSVLQQQLHTPSYTHKPSRPKFLWPSYLTPCLPYHNVVPYPGYGPPIYVPPSRYISSSSSTSDTAGLRKRKSSGIGSRNAKKASTRKPRRRAPVIRKAKAPKQNTTGVLTPAQVAALPCEEHTDSVVARILGLAPNTRLEDAWPQEMDPWRYNKVQVLMLTICCSPGHRATFEEIETYLIRKYPALKTTLYGKKWRGTLRGHLSHRPEFRRILRPDAHGDYWTIDITKLLPGR